MCRRCCKTSPAAPSKAAVTITASKNMIDCVSSHPVAESWAHRDALQPGAFDPEDKACLNP